MFTTGWWRTTRGMPGCDPSSRLSTDGVVALVAESEHPSHDMPANQKACTFSSGPMREAGASRDVGSSMCSMYMRFGRPKSPISGLSWLNVWTGPSRCSSDSAGVIP